MSISLVVPVLLDAYTTPFALQSVRIEGTKVMTYAQSQLERIHMRQVLDDVNIYTHQLLVRTLSNI